MLTAALIEQEIAEGYGDDSLIPALGEPPPHFEVVDGNPTGGKLPNPATGLDSPPGAVYERDTIEVASFQPVYAEMPEAPVLAPPTGLHDSMLTAQWAWRWFPMGGWVYHGVAAQMEREDQGQDYRIPLGHHTIAPSWGKCIHHLYDRPWPYGFGTYAVVWIGGKCRFQNAFWYIGHNNGWPMIGAGEWFHSEAVLATPNHDFIYGWGWTELGHAPGGYPGPWGEGARNHWRFAPALKWAGY